MNYDEYLKSKVYESKSVGFDLDRDKLNPQLKEFQKDIVLWSLKKGKSAIFADCGLGKTFMQLEWAKHVHAKTNKPILILAPLAVSEQTKDEGKKFNICDINIARSQKDIINGVNITNYEMIDHFNDNEFAGIVLDESSILKSFSGQIRNNIIDLFKNTPYKLACTATPSPNDLMELGNHSEFLNELSYNEMLAMFFVHDGGDTSKWRLKGHAPEKFYEWVGTWAVFITKPSDLGYDDEGYELPPLNIHEIVVSVKNDTGDALFPMEAQTLQERQQARKNSINERVSATVELVNNEPLSQWIIWCNLNNESEMVSNLIPNAYEVTGSDDREYKSKTMLSFSKGDVDYLVTKPSIAGFGMNWQNCHSVILCGLSDSYEQFYQVIRRCWRFGQKYPVDVYIVTAETEGAVVANIKRKEEESKKLIKKTIKYMSIINKRNLKNYSVNINNYKEHCIELESAKLVLGDCVTKIKDIETNSIHYSIFSPPFADLYTYSNLEQDMGNNKDYNSFFTHFRFLVKELHRIIMPGRLLSFHCMNLPISKQREGFIGIRDFRGQLIRIFQHSGFIYHSEVCIWKDPVVAMQRTKAIGLLNKQKNKDATISRQGIPDYLVTMRKRGDNPEPVRHDNEDIPIKLWQQYASPVWMDINPSNTLQKTSAREDKDEKHICPLQLDVIERAIHLWTNPNDIVFTPFMGIGSECYQALKMGRRAYGIELKESYYKQAVANCEAVIAEQKEELLF